MSKIQKDEDGKYVWEYEIDMYKNKNILDLVMKILTGIYIFIVVVMIIATSLNGIFDWESFLFFMKICIPIFLFVYVVGYGAYYVYALSLGGYYCARFEMDEEGVKHIPMEKELDYYKKVGKLAMYVGLLTKSLGNVGTGLYMTTLEDVYSKYSKVTSVKGDRKHDLINVNYVTLNNQIYASPEDYDFVFDYIAEHCPQAKIVKD